MTISVVIITYNQELYIRKAVESVLNQKINFNVELIISDDNSPDDTETIVRKIIENHPNGYWVKYTRHSVNKGMMPNFIWALNQCEGKYIALLDGDDYWTDPLKLMKQYEFMNSNKSVVFSFHDAQRFVENENRFEPYPYLNSLNEGVLPLNILFKYTGGLFPTASAMFRNDLISNLPNYFYSFGVGDTPLFLLAISQGDVAFIKERMCVYRTTNTNWSSVNENYLVKFNNYKLKIAAYEEFDIHTNKRYHTYLKQTIQHLKYQIVFAQLNEKQHIDRKFIYNSFIGFSIVYKLKMFNQIVKFFFK